MSRVKKTQRVYFLVIFLYWLATAVPLPLIVLLPQSRGVDLFQIGILWGVYSVTIVLLEVPTGGLADALGRKRVAMMAYAISLSAGILFLVSFSFQLFLVGWVMAGIGRALSSGALDAWFVDTLKEAEPEIDIQPPLAKAGTVSFLALGMGTLLGGLIPRLFVRLPAEGTAILTPFSMTVVTSILLYLVLLVFVALLVHDSRGATSDNAWRSAAAEVPSLVKDAFQLSRQNPSLLLLLAISVASGLALAGIESLWSPRFAEILGGSEGRSLLFGIIMAGSFVAGMLGNLASIPMSRLLQRRYALLAAVYQGAQGLFLVLLALAGGLVVSITLFWMLYLSLGFLESPNATLVNEEIPSERRSAMLSVRSLAGYVGFFIGSVLLGFLAEHVSISTAWIVAGLVLLVSLILYLQVDSLRKGRQQSSHESETAVLRTD